MSETREHEHPEQATEAVTNDAASEAEGVAEEEVAGMTPDEAEDIVALARSGDEVPVGAEDFAEALAIVDDRSESLLIYTVEPGSKFELRVNQPLPEMFLDARRLTGTRP